MTRDDWDEHVPKGKDSYAAEVPDDDVPPEGETERVAEDEFMKRIAAEDAAYPCGLPDEAGEEEPWETGETEEGTAGDPAEGPDGETDFD